MKNTLSRILAIVAIGLIAICAAPAPASAQDAYQGRFTLSNDVRWSQALLPAGEYTFVLKSAALPAQIILHGPNGFVMVMTSATYTRKGDAPSSITLERHGGMRVVSDLYLAELGIDLRYAIPSSPITKSPKDPPRPNRSWSRWPRSKPTYPPNPKGKPQPTTPDQMRLALGFAKKKGPACHFGKWGLFPILIASPQTRVGCRSRACR